MILRRDLDPRSLQHLTRLLRARLHQQGLQTADRGIFVPNLLYQVTEGFEQRLQLLITLFIVSNFGQAKSCRRAERTRQETGFLVSLAAAPPPSRKAG